MHAHAYPQGHVTWYCTGVVFLFADALHQNTYANVFFFSQHTCTHTHRAAHTYIHVPHIDVKWPDRAACKQAIRLDSERWATLSDVTALIPHTHTRTHVCTHWENSEIWALDLTWQQRLLLSLTPDPFLPDVPSSSAPPCPSLSRRTNVIEESPFGQALFHFIPPLHVHGPRGRIHVHVWWSHAVTCSYKSRQAFRWRCKRTCGLQRQAARRGQCVCCAWQEGTTSPGPPCVWQHWPFSQATWCVCVALCVCTCV